MADSVISDLGSHVLAACCLIPSTRWTVQGQRIPSKTWSRFDIWLCWECCQAGLFREANLIPLREFPRQLSSSWASLDAGPGVRVGFSSAGILEAMPGSTKAGWSCVVSG